MDETASQNGAAIASFMLVSLDGSVFALAMTQVRRVVGQQPLTRLPNLPSYVLGVAAIGGTVVPVLNLRWLIGAPEGGIGDDNELILVGAGDGQYAIYVDRILRIGVEATSAAIMSDAITWNGRSARFLDIETMLAAHANAIQRPLALAAAHMAIAPKPMSAPQSTLPVVSLAVETAGMHIFLPLDYIVELSETLTIAAVPDPRPLFIGAAFFRGALIPVIPLDALLGRSVGAEQWGGFVIVDVEGRRCVLAVKRVIGRVPQSPAAIDLHDALIALLPAPKQAAVASRRAEPKTARSDGVDYLLARIGNRKCGFALDSVAHLHEGCEVSRAPVGTGEGVVGATAIGGRVLPVLDVATQLGLPKPSATVAMIEFKSPGGAFIVPVDHIIGITSIAPDALLTSPKGSAASAVVRRGEELLWIVDAPAIAEMRASDAA
jgi:chemotaxis signal transduction protein